MAYIGQSPKVKRTRFTPQSAAPSNPSEGDVFYSDGTALAEGMYVYKNGSWQEIGAAAGGINYIENSSAESGTTDWSTYDDGASSIPVDGTGGSPSTLTFSQNTSSPLRGTADFDLAKSAADGQGEGVSYDFTIDDADRATLLQISFDFTTSASYDDDDIGIYIYDVTNTTLVRFNGEELKASTQGHYSGYFQAASDSTSYRIIFHVKTTNASAYSLNFDNVRVGPVEKGNVGTFASDFIEFTPTWRGVTSDPTADFDEEKAYYRRVGDTCELYYQANQRNGGEANGSGNAYLELPTGIEPDTDKMLTDNSPALHAYDVGWGSYFRGSTSIYGNTQFLEDSGTFGITVAGLIESTAAVETLQASNFSTLNRLTLAARFPVKGWSSQISPTAPLPSGRAIFVEAAGNGGGTLTANVSPIDWTEVEDNTGSWTGNTFIAPETKTYHFSGAIRLTTAFSGAIIAYKNDSSFERVAQIPSLVFGFFSYQVDLEKGDNLEFRLNVGATLNNSSAEHYIRITDVQRNTDIVLPQELIYAEGAGNDAQAITASTEDINFTEAQDSNGWWDGDSFNCEKTGWYDVSGMVKANATVATWGISIYEDGTILRQLGYIDTADVCQFSGKIYMTQGSSYSMRSDTGFTLSNSTSQHHISIVEIK